MSAAKTLFITGVSSGFGQALAKEALAQGHRVIGTVRSAYLMSTVGSIWNVAVISQRWSSPKSLLKRSGHSLDL